MTGNRRILAIDASTELASVCFTDGERWIERREHAGQRHSAILIEHVKSVLDEAGAAPSTLDEIAFGAGPGSFTGLRIACGIAQGIGYGSRVPVRAVSSLLAIAQASAQANECDAVVAAIDARMNEVYWAAYRRSLGRGRTPRDLAHDNRSARWIEAQWIEVVPPTASPASAVVIPEGSDWCGAGNAFARFATLAAALPGSARMEPSIEVTARAIAELALTGHGTLDVAEHAMPIYVRDKVAFTSAERAAGKARAEAGAGAAGRK